MNDDESTQNNPPCKSTAQDVRVGQATYERLADRPHGQGYGGMAKVKRVALKRTDGGSVGTVYVTADGLWEIWRETTQSPRRWFVNRTDCDETEIASGFATKREAVAYLDSVMGRMT